MNTAGTDLRYELRAGDLEATYLPGCGMLSASLRHRGDEILRPASDMQSARHETGLGIPLLYPWANRLAAPEYAAAGKSVRLDPASPYLRVDSNGLLNHGVRSGWLAWRVLDAHADRLVADLVWEAKELLAVFPYRHRLEMTAALFPQKLRVQLMVEAEEPTPISFGFHPNFDLPGSREDWRLGLPDVRQLSLDPFGIPDGGDVALSASQTRLDAIDLDAAFSLGNDAEMSVSAADRRVIVHALEGFPYAQIYAPAAQPLIAVEPMTAPTNALISGRGLRMALPGTKFCAAFDIRIETCAAGRQRDATLR